MDRVLLIEEETWKDIKTIPYHQAEWPFHQVSNLGRVRVLPGGKVGHGRLVTETKLRKLTQSNRGYVTIRRFLGHTLLVHVLVLNQFVGPCPSGQECRHLNGNRSDNRLENLIWGTPSENAQDKVLHGTDSRGERHHNSKLTGSVVIEIRNRPESSYELADQYGVTSATIRDLRNGRRWKHVGFNEEGTL